MVGKDTPTQSEMDIPYDEGEASSHEDDAIDAAMYAGEVARENWWDGMFLDNMQMKEEIGEFDLKGYMLYSKVHKDFITSIINERHRQQNLGWSYMHDREHSDWQLAEFAWTRLEPIVRKRITDPDKGKKIIIEVCALLLAELEKADHGGN